jgi:pilus assembly protein CpaB
MIRRIVLLCVAVMLSLGTALMVRAWVDATRQASASPVASEAPRPPGKKVLVAGRALPAGAFVRAEDMVWQSWPDENLLPVYLVQGSRAVDDLIGAMVRSGIAAGEPISEGRLVRRGEGGFLAAVLSAGSRAVTVNLSPGSGLSGLVYPGDRVDVIIILSVPAKDGTPERRASETVLSDIRVIAVDQRLDDQAKDVVTARTATLEVTPKQAEIIALVNDMGRISLSLRSLAADQEPGVAGQRSATWDNEATDLIRPPATPEPAAAPAAVPVRAHAGQKVGIVRGTAASEVEFPKALR